MWAEGGPGEGSVSMLSEGRPLGAARTPPHNWVLPPRHSSCPLAELVAHLG